MNEKLMRVASFGRQMDLVANKICPICGNDIDTDSFKDECSKKEYKFSGMCQNCQDRFSDIGGYYGVD